MSRREFSRNQREQIVERAKNAAGEICCEGCALVLGRKKFEIDHCIPEALRPEADKKKPITIAEGQLLGMECCHRGPDGKTNKDVKQIAKAKRENARHLGIAAPKQPIKSRSTFPKPSKPERQGKTPLPPRKLYQEASQS